MLRFLGFCICLTLMSSCDYKPKNQGKSLYLEHCQSCHMEDGQGLGQLFPPVMQSDYIKSQPEALACLIRNGISGEIKVNGTVYNEAMAGNKRLTEVEITNLTYYILKELNGIEKPYSIAEIRLQLEKCN